MYVNVFIVYLLSKTEEKRLVYQFFRDFQIDLNSKSSWKRKEADDGGYKRDWEDLGGGSETHASGYAGALIKHFP